MCMVQKLVFQRHRVHAVVQAALQERIEGQHYDPVKGAQVPQHVCLQHCQACYGVA